MKFSSRKDILYSIVIIVICLFLLWIVGSETFNSKIEQINLWSIFIILVVVVYLLWTFWGTKYELSETTFKYKSGPIRGEICINNIKEIIKGKTMWVGFKPATATKGLIIRYNKFDEIYISPITNESFINHITELNKRIKITSY